MPEGHVIHRLAGELTRVFGGSPVTVTSPQGRFADEATSLDGAWLCGAQAWGKHLFIDFDVPEPASVHIHLGLIGKLRIHDVADPVGVVRLRIEGRGKQADLHGPQWCRLVDEPTKAHVIAKLGPDPLRGDADPERGWKKVHRSSKSIAALLMDQTIAAGVGNIYRAEVLFRQGVSPRVAGSSLRKATWEAIWDDLVGCMRDGVALGRIDTVLDEHSPEVQQRPARDDAHGGEVYVYRRAGEPCLVCQTPIRQADLEGRNLYWCPDCQRGR